MLKNICSFETKIVETQKWDIIWIKKAPPQYSSHF